MQPPDPQEAMALTRAALSDYTREPGRSVAVAVTPHGPEGTFRADVAGALPRPAASLLKVPLALAVEAACSAGRLDPRSGVRAAEVFHRRGPLSLLEPDRTLDLTEVLGLCLALSDNDAAAFLLDLVGPAAVAEAARRVGARQTTAQRDDSHPGGPLLGSTTALDALRLLDAGSDAGRWPLVARALRNSIHNSRIPLGVTQGDIDVAHKTGTLRGVAHDVAVLTCRTGVVRLAFLSDEQHDTLVTGYEMGICTQRILAAWGLSVQATRALPAEPAPRAQPAEPATRTLPAHRPAWGRPG